MCKEPPEGLLTASAGISRILYSIRQIDDDHLSRPGIAAAGSCGLPGIDGRAAHSLLGLAPGGVYLAVPVTRNAGGLLHHRFTLACSSA